MTVGSAIGADRVVAGNRKARDSTQGRRQILGVQVSDLSFGYGGDQRTETIGGISFHHGRRHDLNPELRKRLRRGLTLLRFIAVLLGTLAEPVQRED
ncbi:MAG: hypothetical protein P8Y94_06260 [Acidobacteriota bacterium]